MFSAIAPRYDLLNHVLSFNIDRWWWWRTARAFCAILVAARCACAGFVLRNRGHDVRLQRQAGPGARIVGLDFSSACCERAVRKSNGNSPRWIEADALERCRFRMPRSIW